MVIILFIIFIIVIICQDCKHVFAQATVKEWPLTTPAWMVSEQLIYE